MICSWMWRVFLLQGSGCRQVNSTLWGNHQLLGQLFLKVPNQVGNLSCKRRDCPRCPKLRRIFDRTAEAVGKHKFVRDESRPKWHGWHAARRGLGSNLYALGVPEKVIQIILRHANASTTVTYYVRTRDEQTAQAMAKLEDAMPEMLTVN